MVIIYRYVERLNRLIKIESGLKDYWEAVDHCRIYSNKTHDDYLFYSHGKWFCYDAVENYGFEV